MEATRRFRSRLSGHADLYAHAAARQHDELLRMVALADDNLSLVKVVRTDDGL
jgi:hypothetical protein